MSFFKIVCRVFLDRTKIYINFVLLKTKQQAKKIIEFSIFHLRYRYPNARTNGRMFLP